MYIYIYGDQGNFKYVLFDQREIVLIGNICHADELIYRKEIPPPF